MASCEIFKSLLGGDMPLLALAPMQDVTDLAFWRLMARYGGADVYWTEYFRVHGDSRPEKYVLQSITENPTGRPVVAQLIGNDVAALVRTARELQQYPIAAIDLNLGCPAPVVYRKCAGGGLLREPEKIDAIVGALREAVTVAFTVKTRIGFDSAEVLDRLLSIFSRHSVDLVTVHGRTVKQMYGPGVRYDLIERAARELVCPVLANGNIYSAEQARGLLGQSGVRGLMIGRGAIRNPWLFDQIRARLRGEPEFVPTGRDVLNYIHELWDSQTNPAGGSAGASPYQVQRMKKFMNFIGEGVGAARREPRPTGTFLFEIRRVHTHDDFFRVCEAYLDHDGPMSLEPEDDHPAARTNETLEALAFEPFR